MTASALSTDVASGGSTARRAVSGARAVVKTTGGIVVSVNRRRSDGRSHEAVTTATGGIGESPASSRRARRASLVLAPP